jgi:hypothetical protein
MQLGLCRSSLRIEFCVMCFIGRSPTQKLLCHNLNEESKQFCKDILKYFRMLSRYDSIYPGAAHGSGVRAA